MWVVQSMSNKKLEHQELYSSFIWGIISLSQVFTYFLSVPDFFSSEHIYLLTDGLRNICFSIATKKPKKNTQFLFFFSRHQHKTLQIFLPISVGSLVGSDVGSSVGSLVVVTSGRVLV